MSEHPVADPQRLRATRWLPVPIKAERDMARLLSVNVGLPRDIEWKGRTVHTGIWKNPVRGRCRVGRLNLDGDGQGDLAGHGGEQRAVFVYQIESYRYWQEQLKRTDFVHGQFGENFTIEGLPDDAVCIGDRYQIGSALFEVTQPRVTCYRVGIRMNEPRMPALLTSSGRPGFYFRVLQEGEVGAGDEIVKVGEAKERMTVAEINALLYSPNHARDRLERALRIEALSPGWRSSFEALLQSQTTAAGSGNAGLAPAAAAHPVAPGFRPLAVTAIDQESADVLSLTMQSPDGQPLPTALPGQYVVLRLQPDRRRPAALSQLLALGSPLDGALSNQREDRAEWGGRNLPAGACPGGRCSRRQLAARKLHSAVRRAAGGAAQRGNRGDACSGDAVRAGGGPLDTAGLVAARGSRSAASSIRRRSPPPHARAHRTAAAMFVTAGRARATRWARISTLTGHLSRSVFDEVGVPREADVYLCGPTRFMADMKEALAALGVAPERIHVEIFNGSESMTPGVVGAATRAPHLPKDDANTGPLVSFARSGIAAHWKASAYQSILELAEACDVPVRWSCRTGVCHNCESGLVSGAVAYEPEPLDKPADGNLLVCCSQPIRDVVIDL